VVKAVNSAFGIKDSGTLCVPTIDASEVDLVGHMVGVNEACDGKRKELRDRMLKRRAYASWTGGLAND